MEKLYEANLVPKDAKLAFLGKNHEVVPVPPNRTQSVPVLVQVVPVPPYRMCMVPVPKQSGTSTTVSKMPRFL